MPYILLISVLYVHGAHFVDAKISIQIKSLGFFVTIMTLCFRKTIYVLSNIFFFKLSLIQIFLSCQVLLHLTHLLS